MNEQRAAISVWLSIFLGHTLNVFGEITFETKY
jgi:hypothetical protein